MNSVFDLSSVWPEFRLAALIVSPKKKGGQFTSANGIGVLHGILSPDPNNTTSVPHYFAFVEILFDGQKRAIFH